jgi:hypothetical protein
MHETIVDNSNVTLSQGNLKVCKGWNQIEYVSWLAHP